MAVASCFSLAVDHLHANPTDPTVVSGSANFNRQGNVLSVTNSPGAIINWRAFSIGSNEVTRFIQQSAASSVLNRVTGVDPSVILGALQSNGRVFLINPNGILFGAGAQIDVGGLVASTLNISNADFAAGRMRFTDTPGAGNIANQGSITTPAGGQIYLIAPNVQNSGIINSPQGEVILAAGRSVEIVDAGTPNLRIEITAPDTQAVNLGQILASSGKIGIYAALIKNSGIVRADGVVIGQNGEILLKATKNVTLDKGSVVSASGPTAGKITIQADSGNVSVAGTVAANATQGPGGTVSIAGSQGVSVDATGKVSADGLQGGSVALASSAGSVAVAGTVTANATAGRAGQIALNAATNAAVTAGAQLLANGVQGGSVSITGSSGVTFDNGTLVQASGVSGGMVNIQAGSGAVIAQGTVDVTGTDLNGGAIGINAAGDITLDVTSRLLARGRSGGQVRVEASNGMLLSSGLIDGQGSGGPGGMVWLLAPRVALVPRSVIDVSGETDGGTVSVTVEGLIQSGTIRADGLQGAGGTVAIDATSTVIQTESALISATGATLGGTVTINAGTDGNVFSSGTVIATGAHGGNVQVLAGNISLLAATLDASGINGGGTILVGGDLHGGGTALHAATTFVNFSTNLHADALSEGDGGKVVVWSDEKTTFYGSVSARGGSIGGNGGIMEVSSKQSLTYGGHATASAANGAAGVLLLDPHNIIIDSSANSNTLNQRDLVDPNPNAGGSFGDNLRILANGNTVITDTNDNFGGAGAGAAYLFNGATGALISVLTGSHAGDAVGSGGIYTLYSTGNYLVLSPNWNSAAGAVTFGSMTTGTGSGVLSATNSLVGANPGDSIGSYGITLTPQGNYLVMSPSFNGGRGAITFGSATSGVSGTVSSSNSLVGSLTTDNVGADGAEGLVNFSNMIIHTSRWNNNAGAITWMNGATGKLSDGSSGGVISTANSLVGSSVNDYVGGNGWSELSSGHVLVFSSDWNSSAGAVTWMNGGTGKLSNGATGGAISSSNSLIGSAPNEYVGDNGYNTLFGGNLIVRSPYWSNSGTAAAAGAVTWMNGNTGVLSDGSSGGVIGTANSIVGTAAGDHVGWAGFLQITNGAGSGNLVIRSPDWNGGTGAVTWMNGGNGLLANGLAGGQIDGTNATASLRNSLIGSAPGEYVGSSVLESYTGNVFVATPNWTNGGTLTNAGAITWLSGTNGKLNDGVTPGGVVGASNSLVGSANYDDVGSSYIQLYNGTAYGNLIALSPYWNNNTGAVTWIEGSTGKLSTGATGGAISSANSLIGSAANEYVGYSGTMELVSGNVIVPTQGWTNGGTLTLAGAVSWINGTNGLLSDDSAGGVISAANSLVGNANNSQIGSSGTFQINNGFGQGNVLVLSPKWNTFTGAVTWINGSTGTLSNGASGGTVSTANSVIGSAPFDQVGGNGYLELLSGNVVLTTLNWSNGGAFTNAGAVTWLNGSTGQLTTGTSGGVVSAANSLVGNANNDKIGWNGAVYQIANDNVLIMSSQWSNNGTTPGAGAVSWMNGATGLLSNATTGGTVSSANSLVGASAGDFLGTGFGTLPTGNLLFSTPNWGGGKGAISWMDASSGLLSNGAAGGVISAANSVVGGAAGDNVGSNVQFYGTSGNALVISPNWNGNTGAITWINGSTGRLSNGATGGAVSVANSLVGSAAGEFAGNFQQLELDNGNLFVLNPGWSNGGSTPNAGAYTWMNGFTGALSNGATGGVIGTANSLVGSATGELNGNNALAVLANGNLIIKSPNWSGGTGAVTWMNGFTGKLSDNANGGTISVSNSLVGSTTSDAVGNGGYYTVTELYSGNALIYTPSWSGNGANAGAVTWINGANGKLSDGSTGGVISASNSLIGSAANDNVGASGVIALQYGAGYGNALILSGNWNSNTGAVTWMNGNNGLLSNGQTGGVIDGTTPGLQNSLIGSFAGDFTGGYYYYQLYNSGNVLIRTPNWSNGGTLVDAGAITWMNMANGTLSDGSTGGVVGQTNSLVGSISYDNVGNYGIYQTLSGNYLVISPDWNNQRGAVTFGSGTAGIAGTVSAGNSLVGTTSGDRVGDGGEGGNIFTLPNGNFLIGSPYWNNSAGAITLGSDTLGVSGVVSAANSVIGGVSNSSIHLAGIDYTNNNFIVESPNEPGGRVVVGSNVYIPPAGGGNLLFGTAPGTDVTISPTAIAATLSGGTAVILQANNDITLNSASDILTNAGGSGGNLTLQAGRSIILNSSITTDNGNLSLTANDPTAISANRDPGAAVISTAPGTVFDAGTGTVSMVLSTGSTAGNITTGNGTSIFGSQISILNNGAGGSIVLNNTSLVATGIDAVGRVPGGAAQVSLFADNSITLNGGSISVTGGAGNSGMAGGNATLTMVAANGNIAVNGATLTVRGGAGGASSTGGAGGDATATFTAGNGSVSINGSTIAVTGGAGGDGSSSGGFGGNAHMTINAGALGITITNSSITVTGGKGGYASSGLGGSGGSASAVYSTPGGIAINNSTLAVVGGAGGGGYSGSGNGGDATFVMTPGGAITITNSGLAVVGGNGGSAFSFNANGGNAQAIFTAGAGITMTNTGLAVIGGGGGSASTGAGGAGGTATLNMQATGGNIAMTSGGILVAGGVGGSGVTGGAGGNALGTIQAGAGSITLNGTPVLVSGGAGGSAMAAVGTGNLSMIAGSTLNSNALSFANTSSTYQSGTGMSVITGSDGTSLVASNIGATGDVVLTSTAPLFTIGGAGAIITNGAAGGGYYISSAGDMVLNNGMANNKPASFSAGGLLTVNGYANGSGGNVSFSAFDLDIVGNVNVSGALNLVGANSLTVNGPTNVGGALSVLAGSMGVYANLQAASVNVTAKNLTVDAANFDSNAADFTGLIADTLQVANGGRIFGNPDIKLTVGNIAVPGTGIIKIDGPGSVIEAYSPNSIHILFPGLNDGGFVINGTPKLVWDPVTMTGFFIGQTGQPAMLGVNLLLDYGIVGLPQQVVQAINTAIASINQLAPADQPPEDPKDKNKTQDKNAKEEKTLSNNVKLLCN